MRVLLDTSYLYDVMEAPGKFLGPERRFLAAREVRIHVSAVSIWEMRLKHTARHLYQGRARAVSLRTTYSSPSKIRT